MTKRVRLIFLFILTLSFYLRFFGIDWDLGNHLHPDERMIIMVSERIKLPGSLNEIFSKNSVFNPNFFAYGSFPIYLLAITSDVLAKILKQPNIGNYDGMLYVGRALSSIFDVLTVAVIYYLTLSVYGVKKHKQALLASFFYSISVLPIQASHFYAVDIPLVFLSTLSLYISIKLFQKPTLNKTVLLGIVFGLAVATKITIVIIALPIFVSLLITGFKLGSPKTFLRNFLLVGFFSVVTFLIAMPYAAIEKDEFIKQITLQLQMNKNPYIFPYTLQYVNTPPYIYYINNIILWGLGVPFGIVAITSTLFQSYEVFKNVIANKKKSLSDQLLSQIILLIFFIGYFFVVGRSAVKFMRYMLPLYPLLAIFTAFFAAWILIQIKKNKLITAIIYILIFSFLIWPFSFIKIYAYKPTRVLATEWIIKNIPKGSSIAVEHWDDRLPLKNSQDFQITDLPLYERENKEKWNRVSEILFESEYIIIASNRLYVPLPKLTNCIIHKNYCYLETANYYKDLFDGKLGFIKIVEFDVKPSIPFINLKIDDLDADESFTVYDHPKIMIFKKTQPLERSEYIKRITDLP